MKYLLVLRACKNVHCGAWNGFSLQRNKAHFMLVLLSAEFGTVFYLCIKNLQLRFIKMISTKKAWSQV